MEDRGPQQATLAHFYLLSSIFNPRLLWESLHLKTCPLLAVLILVALPACVSLGEDWPGWRGPRGDGTSRETNVPLHWSATENVNWKTPIPGAGRSSPIVKDHRVFVTTGDAADESRRVLCLDRETGELLWNIAVHHGSGGRMHRLNSTASSTPAADDERVYAVFVDDRGMRVVSVDFAGRVVWSVSPGDFESQHGFAASPVLYGAGVIVNGQQDGGAFVVMLSRDTGAELWRYQPAVNLRSFSTPVLIQHDGDDQLILAGAGRVYFFEDSGRCTVIENGAAFDVIATNEIGESVYATPAISAGGLFVRTETHLAHVGPPAE